jgi:choline dehydrogenase-like flavoprotein
MTDYQDTWYDSKGKAFQLQIHYFVGGANELYVVDAGFFPSIGAVNPALIAMAKALRVGDYLIEGLGATTR